MDIFQRRTTFGGGFNAATAKVLFAGFKTGLAFESISINYSQQVALLWDLDGEGGHVYMVAGHATGGASINKVIGPSSLSQAFYQRYADVCRVAENTMMLEANIGCISKAGGAGSVSGSLRVTLNGVLMESVNLGLTADNPIIRSAAQLRFIGMDWVEQTTAQAAANNNIRAA